MIGILQIHRKQNHTIRNTSPPPSDAFLAHIRGKRQMLPVPTIEPMLDTSADSDDEKVFYAQQLT
jgi:hypothetical protein